MVEPILHDAVTLRHFAAVRQLDLLESRHGFRPEPRWCHEVKDEIENGVNGGAKECDEVLACGWLGPAQDTALEEALAVYEIQVGLNDGVRPATEHRGEAQSIFLAEQCNGRFVTDDNSAYDFARKRTGLGEGRVFDTVDVLREAVAAYEITASDAVEIVQGIRDADRYLRRVHPEPMSATYF